MDVVYRVPQRPGFEGPQSKLRLSGHTVRYGGQVATALATCAAFGLRAAYAGAAGTDEESHRLLDALVARGVNTSLTVRRPGGSQFAAILIDDSSGERVVLWDRPETLHMADHELPVSALQSARVVLIDDVDARASVAAARCAREAGGIVVTDLDHVTPHTEAIIRTASFPIMSEHLPAALTGEHDPERALRHLRRWNPGLLVMTAGERGAVALDGDRLIVAEGIRVPAVDTTGSGDVFRGAFIAGLLQGMPVEHLLRLANAAAAVSCTRAGALDSVPSPEDVRALL